MTMYAIASQIITTNNVGSFSFTNIPQDFQHLQIRTNVRLTGNRGFGNQVRAFYNNDSTNGNYTWHSLGGNSSSAFSEYYATDGIVLSWVTSDNVATNNSFSVGITDILDYSSTSKLKITRTITGENMNDGNGLVALFSSAWNNSGSGINRIDFNWGGTLAAGSRVDLYGINSTTVTGA